LQGGNAAYGGSPPFTDLPTDGVVYGSALLVPWVGGSGGGGDDTRGGGGGGGAILFSSSTQVVHDGSIQAIGFLSGAGNFNVIGGNGRGGPGRIRLDLIDRTGLSANLAPPGTSIGSFMTVFPSVIPRLDIVHVAGRDLPPGTPSPITITLPFGSPAPQEVRVRAQGFTGLVPISIVLTPDSGDRIVVDTEVDADGTPPEVSISADFPQNIATRVHAWTR
jgi:hypothetical protein